MYLDVKGCPLNKSLAEHIAEKVSCYVRVADFCSTKKGTVFRMLVDPDLSAKQLQELLALNVQRWGSTYKLRDLECVMAPVSDTEQANHQNPNTMYMRLTYVS